MKKIFALVYQSYLNRGLSIPYLRALMTLIGGILIFLSIVWGLLKTTFLNPFSISSSTTMNLLAGAFFIILLILFFSFLFKKRELRKYIFTKKELKNASLYIVIYILSLIFLLIFTLILKAKQIL